MNVDWIQRIGLVMLTGAAMPACQQPTGASERGISLPLQSEETELSETAIDLGVCRGTDCTAPTDDRPRLDGEPRSCEPEERGDMRLAWYHDYTMPGPECTSPSMPCGPQPRVIACEGLGECAVSDFRVAVGRDDTLWVLASLAPLDYEPTMAGLWLARYSADGEEISEQVIAGERVDEGQYVYYSGALAVGADGHAFVTVGKQSGTLGEYEWSLPVDDESVGWLVEFDADGAQVGARVPITGLTTKPSFTAPRPLPAGPGRLALCEQALVSGSLALIATETREVRWVQTREGRIGSANAASDAKGRVSILTMSPDSSPSGRVEHYAASGELAWERTLPWREQQSGFPGPGNLLVDDQGSVLVSTSLWTERQQTVVQKIAEDGEAEWATSILFPMSDDVFALPGGLSTASILPGADGTLYVPGGSSQSFDEAGMPGPAVELVYELSSDGERCGMWRWQAPPEIALQSLSLGQDAFFFTSWSGFGRLER